MARPSSLKLREFAEEARIIAGTFSDNTKARDRMLAIAAEYDDMAKLAERPPR